MDVEQWKRVKELYLTVVELEPDKRSAILDEACKNDAALRAKVEALLSADTDTGEILIPRPGSACTPVPISEKRIGTRIGHYHLTHIISSGGMGTVYEAIQEHPKRIVAVKVMKSGIASQSALRRFEYEAQILAKLRHSHIAQVIEAGTHVVGEEGADGVPYFVMEYIPEAKPITEYANEKAFSTSERLRLFMQVCDAVHHGHQKGIIHRDLKPANLLVDASGQVKVIDFGIAKATDADLALTTVHTDMGQLLGTVQYMSPEQCLGDTHDLDLRSDVYSLGVVLYELLCGKLPYEARKIPVFEATRRIREEPPERPSTVDRTLRGDLETIVLKVLEKERDRRYPSADAFRRDLDHYLKGEPILARPPSTMYLLHAFTRRHKALVFGTAAVFIVLVAGIITTTMNAIRADREAEAAQSINAFYNELFGMVDTVQLYRESDLQRTSGSSPVSMSKWGREITVAELLEEADREIDRYFKGKPELEAKLRETIGMTFLSMGRHEEAEQQLIQVIEIRKAYSGVDHIDTFRTQIQLGYLWNTIQKFTESEQLLKPALAHMQDSLGEEDMHCLACARVLATALSGQGKWTESEPLYVKTMEIQEGLMGKAYRQTLSTMQEYAVSLCFQSRLKEQCDLTVEIYDIIQGLDLNENDHIMCNMDGLWGGQYFLQKKYVEAEPHMRTWLEKCQRILGDEHPTTYLAKMHVALCIKGEERIEEEIHYWRESWNGFRNTLGMGHSSTHYAGNELFDSLMRAGKVDEAEEVRRVQYDSTQKELGRNDPQTMRYMDYLSEFLLEHGNQEEARMLFRQWVGLHSDTYGRGNRKALGAMMVAADAMRKAKQSDEARRYIEEAISDGEWRMKQPEVTPHDICGYARVLLNAESAASRDPAAALRWANEALGRGSEEDTYIITTLAMAYDANGDLEKAVELQRKAVETLHARPMGVILKGWWRDTILESYDAERQLVRYLFHKGEDEEAERVLFDFVRKSTEALIENSNNLATRITGDAMMLIEEGRYALAEPLILKAYELRVEAAFILECKKMREKIILMYESWGKDEKAEEWRAKGRALAPNHIKD